VCHNQLNDLVRKAADQRAKRTRREREREGERERGIQERGREEGWVGGRTEMTLS
jgi:hypothetical protein